MSRRTAPWILPVWSGVRTSHVADVRLREKPPSGAGWEDFSMSGSPSRAAGMSVNGQSTIEPEQDVERIRTPDTTGRKSWARWCEALPGGERGRE